MEGRQGIGVLGGDYESEDQYECSLSLNQFCMRGNFVRHGEDLRHSSINGTIRFKGGCDRFLWYTIARKRSRMMCGNNRGNGFW